jgi:hypothetical protein
VSKLAAAEADADLASLRPHYVRDKRKVIRYAELRSDRPIVASAVLSAKFPALFKETLGDRLLVAVRIVSPRLFSPRWQAIISNTRR